VRFGERRPRPVLGNYGDYGDSLLSTGRVHDSCAGRGVCRSIRGFGPALPGARGRPSRPSSAAIHSSARAVVRSPAPARCEPFSRGRLARRERRQSREAAHATAPPFPTRHTRPPGVRERSTTASLRHGAPTPRPPDLSATLRPTPRVEKCEGEYRYFVNCHRNRPVTVTASVLH
jgi:hypothetical protein